MAEEKTYTQLIDEAHYKEHLGSPIKIHSPRKYKKESRRDPDEMADVGSGTRLIIRVMDGRTCEGYLLGAVVDIEDDDSWWSFSTKFIVEVLDASNEKLSPEIGRLRSVRGKEWYWGGDRHVVEVGKLNWIQYKI